MRTISKIQWRCWSMCPSKTKIRFLICVSLKHGLKSDIIHRRNNGERRKVVGLWNRRNSCWSCWKMLNRTRNSRVWIVIAYLSNTFRSIELHVFEDGRTVLMVELIVSIVTQRYLHGSISETFSWSINVFLQLTWAHRVILKWFWRKNRNMWVKWVGKTTWKKKCRRRS